MIQGFTRRYSKWGLHGFACVLLSLCTLSVVCSQEVQPITLEVVLQLGGANNLTIQEYTQRQELAVAKLSKSKEWWLPELYAGVQTHQLWGAAINSDGRYYLDVNRNSLWTGLGLDARWNFSNGLQHTKSARFKAQAAQFQTQAKRNQVLLEIIDTYYDFAAAQLNYLAYQQLAAQADTISRQIELQVLSGLRYESELLLSKSTLNHLRVLMLSAKVSQAKQSAALVRLLNLDPEVQLVSVDSVMAPLNLLSGDDAIAFDVVYQNRPEFRSAQLAISALEAEKKTVTSGLLIPELRLNTYGSYFGALDGKVSPVLASQYPDPEQLYSTGAVNISLLWRIPLGRFVYGGDLHQYQSRIGIGRIQLEQVRATVNEEVLAARNMVSTVKEQMDIAQEGSLYASEALHQSVQRQALGTVRPFEILQAQEIFIKARLDYITAVAEYNKAQYALLVAKGGNL